VEITLYSVFFELEKRGLKKGVCGKTGGQRERGEKGGMLI
jgi:hypothetical protein